MQDDAVRLRHMLRAAQDAICFVQGHCPADLRADRQLLLALTKSLEIIGEAAAQVSAAGRAKLPDFPWHEMIGMRNHLVHGYYAVNADIVWNTVQHDLPALIAQLERMLVES